VGSTYYQEVKELMASQGYGRCTLDQAHVFDKLGVENYKRILKLVFQKSTIEFELENRLARRYAFVERCRRRTKEIFKRLRVKITTLEKEKHNLNDLQIADLEHSEIFTRTLEGIFSN